MSQQQRSDKQRNNVLKRTQTAFIFLFVQFFALQFTTPWKALILSLAVLILFYHLCMSFIDWYEKNHQKDS